MARKNKTQETDNSVAEFLHSLDNEQVMGDCLKLIETMANISGSDPKMWGPSIIGFDSYHYVYASGREGDAPVLGFSPRKGKIAVYIDSVDGSGSAELFAKLGKHTVSKVCIYIKRLDDIDLSVLTQILEKSYSYTKSLAADEHTV